jgi:hypothetical protein
MHAARTVSLVAFFLVPGCSSCRGGVAPAARNEPVKKWTSTTERFSAPAGTLHHLQADGSALYWTSCASFDAPCSLLRLARDASKPTVLAVRPSICAVALDDASVYFASGEQILRVGKTGASPTVLAEGIAVVDLQVAGGFVYAGVADTRDLDGPSASPHAGSFVRIPLSGGKRVVLGEHHAHNPRMAVDQRRIYFLSDTWIDSIPVTGGTVDELVHDERNAMTSLALDGEAIFFTAGGEVRRVAKSGGAVTVLYRAQIVLDVRAASGVLYATRNLAYDRSAVAETAALVRIDDIHTSHPSSRVLTELHESPQALAVDPDGVYLLLRPQGAGPDRVLALPDGS